jgi:hypothetical protein
MQADVEVALVHSGVKQYLDNIPVCKRRAKEEWKEVEGE